MKKTHQAPDTEFEIETLATDARGIAKPAGEPIVFIEGALPGERVLASVYHQKRSFREAKLKRIVRPSPARVTPLCPHYECCGGCNLQHMEIPSQQLFKQKWLLETLKKIGQWPIPEIEKSAAILEFVQGETESYRQRIRLHCNSEQVGFRARKSHSIANVHDCIVACNDMRKNWKELRASIIDSHSQNGSDEFEVTLSAEQKLVIQPVNRRNRTLREETKNNPFFPVAHPFVGKILVHNQSFVQPHKSAMSLYAKKIHEVMLNYINKTRPEIFVAWDLYAGSGPFSMLASLAAESLRISCQTTAVEGVGFATEALRKNTAPWNVECITADVKEFCEREHTKKPHVVVLDPPRAGASPDVMHLIAKACAPNSLVINVACDAASLARDSRVLFEHGFSLTSLTLYDMFSHTNHYETIAVFARSQP
jgi:23S rRNA (uracil1939-C5)-methyltransferase